MERPGEGQPAGIRPGRGRNPGAGGNRLRLDPCLLWLGAADYQIGSPRRGSAGHRSPRRSSPLASIRRRTRSSLRSPACGARTASSSSTRSTSRARSGSDTGPTRSGSSPRITPALRRPGLQAGFRPRVLQRLRHRGELLTEGYEDADYPILNGHRSMFWGLPEPEVHGRPGAPAFHSAWTSWYVPGRARCTVIHFPGAGAA